MTDLFNAKLFVSKLPLVQMKPDELAHYGVLGMHWGRHLPGRTEKSHNSKQTRKKYRSSDDGSKTKKKYSSSSSNDHIVSRELLTIKKHQLSNADIDKVVARLQREQRLSQLNPSNFERGKKITLGVIAGVGTYAGVYNFSKSPAGKAAISRGAKIVKAILKR